MYTRSLKLPNQSFFLFGPRGTGKTTWLNKQLQPKFAVNLLLTKDLLRYQSEPGLFRHDLLKKTSNKGGWVVIDEVQKLPLLLDEVHALIEEKRGLKFAMTGSSARKLRRGGANLLAGRAITEYLFPLTASELGDDLDLKTALRFGTLPSVVTERDTRAKERLLESYAETYLKEEIQQEALAKNLSSFARFLKVAAIQNGQRVNMSSLARDAGVKRPTILGYFQVLRDTLLGELLEPWPLKFRVKEVDHPKFYFFDTGVQRVLSNQLREEPDEIELGQLLETWAFNELRAYNRYRDVGGELHYWATHAEDEVDFVFSRGRRAVGIEVKASRRWRPEYGKSLRLLLDAKKIERAIVLYLGESAETRDGIEIRETGAFLRDLGAGKGSLL